MLHFPTEADFQEVVTSLTCSDLQKSSGFRIISSLSQRFAPINFAACCASAEEYIKSVFIKIEIVHGTHMKTRKNLIITCLYQGRYVDQFSCSPLTYFMNY